MIKSIRAFPVLFLTGMILLTSCNDNPTSFNDEPPQLPSERSMTMDMSEFGDQDAQSKIGEVPSIQSEDAFFNAAIRAAIMKAVVDVNLAIPRVLLTAATAANPEFNEEGEWVWTFSRSNGEHTYEVRLVATQVSDDQNQWDFYVSSSEFGISDRLFFSGLSSSDGTEGVWTYYNLDPEASDEPVSSVEWRVNGEDDVSLRLEILSESNGHQGDFIEYTFDGTIKHAVYYNAAEDANTEIQWNVETNAGYLIAPDFNDGVKACWDSSLQDTACEEA